MATKLLLEGLWSEHVPVNAPKPENSIKHALGTLQIVVWHFLASVGRAGMVGPLACLGWYRCAYSDLSRHLGSFVIIFIAKTIRYYYSLRVGLRVWRRV